jgi:cation transport regulator ChaC
MTATWVFGYGSLVSPWPLGQTLGREVVAGDGWHEAVVRGWARRWNYGAAHVVGRWRDPHGVDHERTIVALGVTADAAGWANGVVVRVDAAELARLDQRERSYDRIDVSATTETDGPLDGPVVTYVPSRSAIDRYERARDAGLAAIEQRYWNLVTGAFQALGADRLRGFEASTPPPDVPVLELQRS